MRLLWDEWGSFDALLMDGCRLMMGTVCSEKTAPAEHVQLVTCQSIHSMKLLQQSNE